eukprot:TRINITY_DN10945_c0_g1_i1.p2 TRINITY_DN10945_c0_g1~~TRINITY_DN10945_c0_g1_i1.p2  ORF type:complete len:119 (-),score=25.80 TRINITY_DN10945_c0_g1_i1:85-441(-)
MELSTLYLASNDREPTNFDSVSLTTDRMYHLSEALVPLMVMHTCVLYVSLSFPSPRTDHTPLMNGSVCPSARRSAQSTQAHSSSGLRSLAIGQGWPFPYSALIPVSYTHLTLPTIYSV